MSFIIGDAMLVVWFIVFMLISIYSAIFAVKTPYLKIKPTHFTLRSLWYWGWSFIALIIIVVVSSFVFQLSLVLLRYSGGIHY